jgi:hypothetical protein
MKMTENEQSTPKITHRKRAQKPAIIRTHKVETISRNILAQTLDAYHEEGREIIALNLSRDIGGTYEIVSFVTSSAGVIND